MTVARSSGRRAGDICIDRMGELRELGWIVRQRGERAGQIAGAVRAGPEVE
jgi:hypothetical protein